MRRREEALGRCDKQAREVAKMLRRIIDDIVLTVNDHTYRPEKQFEGRGIRGRWDPLPNDDSGDWESCVIEIHECRPPEELAEVLLACDVVPGIYAPSAQIHWRAKWKTQITMFYELEAAIDNRSVNFLTQFDLEDQ
jgi:hypothetical protein